MTEERLHGGIVPAVTLSRHGLLEAYLFNSSLEPRIRVVKTLVRMDGGFGVNVAIQSLNQPVQGSIYDRHF